MFELLKKVLSPVGPSGLEAPVAEVIREEIAAYVDTIVINDFNKFLLKMS